MGKQKIIRWVLLISVLLLMIVFYDSPSIRSNKLLSSLPIQFSLKGNFIATYKESRDNTLTLKFQSKRDILIIQIYFNKSELEARRIIDDKRFIIDSLFTMNSPQQVAVLQYSKGCPELSKYQISMNDKGNIHVSYRLLANKHLVFGGCSREMNYYRTVLSLLYCGKENSLYEIKYYTPIKKSGNRLGKLINSISCKN